ncbi:antioxidant 1 copper chaperone [Dermacentor variabilis]|uniref:antioxidant 1 copper chaperone n=1 Tax=Dermacentor variabilis TaxID=34621 RepID=UPI003F5C5949
MGLSQSEGRRVRCPLLLQRPFHSARARSPIAFGHGTRQRPFSFVENQKLLRSQKMASQVHEFHVEMTCEGCSGAVQRVLGKLADQGVNKVDIDLKAQRVFVDSTLSCEQLLEVLKKAGKTCSYVGVKK